MGDVAATRKLGGYEFYHQHLGSPKHVVAPMVDMSELAFRMLCRRYGAHLCYTPMLHSRIFLESDVYREKHFTTCAEDRPLVVQFCANEPDTLLQAARMVEDRCDAVDLNLGCPQMIAKRGYYGSYLMEDWPLIHDLVKTLHDNLKVPVFCKIRVYPGDPDKTVAYAKMLESAGCQLLTVHGRTRDQRKCFNGDGVFVPADWSIIKRVKESLSIPVFGNGNIQKFDDVGRLMQSAGVDGVMSACTLLNEPALFSGTTPSPFTLALEYIDMCQTYDTPLAWIKAHLVKILQEHFTAHLDVQELLFDESATLELADDAG
jgi:tRNA-dihydrouridine synthase 1